MSGVARLRCRGQSGSTPVISLDMALRPSGRQLLVSDTSIAAVLSGLSDDATVTVNATGVADHVPVVYAPLYTTKLYLGPGAAWDGIGDKGYLSWTEDGVPRTAVPAADTRVDGMPTLQMAQVWNQAFDDEITLMFDGDPELTQVRVYCEGAYVDITERTVFQWEEFGEHWWHEGFHCTLKRSLFTDVVPARPASGYWECNVFARGYTDRPGFETTLIGTALSARGAAAATTAANFKAAYRFFPDTQLYDWERTVSLSGFGQSGSGYAGVAADYTDLDDAIAAAIAAGAKRPRILVTETGSFNPANNASAYNAHRGYFVLETAPGVTATLAKPTYTAGATSWLLGAGGVELRGDWFVDCENATGLNEPTTYLPSWLHGGRVGTSITDISTYLWNDKTPLQLGVGYFRSECRMDYGFGGFVGVNRNVHFAKCTQDMFRATPIVSNVRIDQYVGQWDNNLHRNALIVNYVGAQATFSISKSAATGTTSATITLTDGVSPQTTPAMASFASYAALAAYIDGLADWTCTVHPDVVPNDRVTDRSPIYIEPPSGATGVAKGTPVTLTSWIDHHSDIKSFASTLYTNHLLKNVLGRDFLRIQTFFVDGPARDISMVNLGWDADPYGSTTVKGQFNNAEKSNVVVTHCSDPGTTIIMRNDGSSSTVWASDFKAKASVFAQIESLSEPMPKPELIDCHIATGVTPSGSTLSGNTSSGGDRFTLFRDAANWDLRPAGALVEEANLIAPPHPYDALGATRLPLDAKGALALPLTTRTITGAQAKTLAVYPYDASGDLGQIVLSWAGTSLTVGLSA